jgi:3-hydroxyacyl-CoA dehydrogenase
MKLVEIVACRTTSKETISLLQALTKQIGKIGVVVGNCDGFCGNRLLKSYSAETVLMLTENGATVKDVDQALLDFGMALGPFQMGDLAGNDIAYNIRRERGWVRNCKSDPIPASRPPRYTELGDDMVVQLGRLGQKTGKGWYDYDPSIGRGRKPIASPEVDAFVRQFQQPQSTLREALDQKEIVERVLFPLVNEGFKCLEEGIVQCPGDIDVVYLYGYGWPLFLGGPMHWADHHIGLSNLLQSLRKFHSQFPETEYFTPSTLLQECVATGVTVDEFYRRGLQKKLKSSL